MRANTLHTLHEWEELLAAKPRPDESDKANWLPPELEYLPKEAVPEFLRKQEEFALRARNTQAKTRQGKLLEIIQSDAPFHCILSALYLYRGFHRGFQTIRKMIERENGIHFKLAPPTEDDYSKYYGPGFETLAPALVEWLGWMRTEESHEYLMQLAAPPYHPLIQTEAINAMAFEAEMFAPCFLLNLVKNPETSEPKLYHALYCMMYNSSQYHSREYCEAISPHLMNLNWNIYSEAIGALVYKRAGRKLLQQFYAEHKDKSETPQRLLDEIQTTLDGWA